MGNTKVQNSIRGIIFLAGAIVSVIMALAFSAAFSGAEEIGVVIFIVVLISGLWLASIVSKMFFILPEWEKLVLLRLGKFAGVKGPGLFIIPPFIYSVANVIDTRITTRQVEATATLTKDNVPTKVTAAIEFEVENVEKAVIRVRDYLSSVIWLSTEALKNTIGGLDLRELLSNRDKIAIELKSQIDEQAANYGINVRAVRITDIDTPKELIEELAVIARARRAAQAKQVQAEAEVLVATKMAEASQILSKQKGGFRLREIQNLNEMSKEESAMIIVYPYESSAGRDIANASISQAGRMRVVKK
jgi:regulator of protease activity HflC (stomatin/prohibitin superfamily)